MQKKQVNFILCLSWEQVVWGQGCPSRVPGPALRTRDLCAGPVSGASDTPEQTGPQPLSPTLFPVVHYDDMKGVFIACYSLNCVSPHP